MFKKNINIGTRYIMSRQSGLIRNCPSKLKNMIKSGDQFIAGRSGGVVGAIVPWHGAFAGVAPAHIFYQAGTRDLRLGNLSSKVAYIPNDADLAFFPILGACQPTELGKPHLGDVELKNARHSMRCRISDTSWVHCLCCPAARQPSGSR